MKSKFISIIIPVFNEQGSIEHLYKSIKIIEAMDFIFQEFLKLNKI